MKYIKTFESQVNYLYADSSTRKSSSEDLRKMGYPERFKFKFGDYVRFKSSKYANEQEGVIFQVKVIDASVGVDLVYRLDSVFEKVPNTTWAAENKLEIVPDYEIAAIKYNIG